MFFIYLFKNLIIRKWSILKQYTHRQTDLIICIGNVSAIKLIGINLINSLLKYYYQCKKSFIIFNNICKKNPKKCQFLTIFIFKISTILLNQKPRFFPIKYFPTSNIGSLLLNLTIKVASFYPKDPGPF